MTRSAAGRSIWCGRARRSSGEFGIPIVNKRISVTPMALVASGCDTEDYVPFAHAMDRAAKTCGVDFIGGYSALVQKGFAHGDDCCHFPLYRAGDLRKRTTQNRSVSCPREAAAHHRRETTVSAEDRRQPTAAAAAGRREATRKKSIKIVKENPL